MTCAQIDEFLDQQGAARAPCLPPWVVEHCLSCERCRKLLELLQGGLTEQELPRGLQARIESAVMGSLRPVSPLPPARRLALWFLGTFVLLSLLGIMMGGAGALRVMSSWQFAGVGLILGAGAILLATSLSELMAPGGYQSARVTAVIVSVGAAFVLALALLFPWKTEPKFVAMGLRCASAGLMLMGPAAVCFWLLVRRGAVLSPALAGAATGMLAGLVGPVILHFGCPIAKAPHLLVWHAGIPIAGAVGGALVGSLVGRFAVQKGPTAGRGGSPP